MTPRLVILSGPSGGGKTTIARRLEHARDDVGFSVSATTRPPRANERDGIDYYFFGRETFARHREAGAFVEWSEHFGALYGTLTSEVDRVLGEGRHVLLDIDVEGARQVRAARPDAIAVLVLPPTADALIQRLTRRRSESTDQLRQRMARVDRELAQAAMFDRVVVNDRIDRATAAVAGVIDGDAGAAPTPAEETARIQEIRRAVEAWLQVHGNE